MSDEHKAAMAKGRTEARAIKAYLAVATAPRKPGRPVTTASLEDKIASLDEKVRNEDDPLSRVELIQTESTLSVPSTTSTRPPTSRLCRSGSLNTPPPTRNARALRGQHGGRPEYRPPFSARPALAKHVSAEPQPQGLDSHSATMTILEAPIMSVGTIPLLESGVTGDPA